MTYILDQILVNFWVNPGHPNTHLNNEKILDKMFIFVFLIELLPPGHS